MITSKRITKDEFIEATRSLIGLEITRPWRGIGSALLLEVGPLSKKYERTGNKKAEQCIDLSYSWRVEAARSVQFGSDSSRRKVDHGIRTLAGLRVLEILVTGRLPELNIQLASNRWIHSFATTEGQPDWAIFLRDGSWLTVRRGGLVSESYSIRAVQSV